MNVPSLLFFASARQALAAGSSAFAIILSGCGGAQPFDEQSALGRGEPLPVVTPPAGPVSDLSRGAQLFATAPAPGRLACNDCHSDDPQTRNFGNIFVGRNAPSLIARAIANNTGGMGYFADFLAAADVADIAAYLGNSPVLASFADTRRGARSPVVEVTVRSSTRQAIAGLGLEVQGEFVRVGGNCGQAIERFSSCTIELVFAPTGSGARRGSLLIRHDDATLPVLIPLQGLSLGSTTVGQGGGRYA